METHNNQQPVKPKKKKTDRLHQNMTVRSPRLNVLAVLGHTTTKAHQAVVDDVDVVDQVVAVAGVDVDVTEDHSEEDFPSAAHLTTEAGVDSGITVPVAVMDLLI